MKKIIIIIIIIILFIISTILITSGLVYNTRPIPKNKENKYKAIVSDELMLSNCQTNCDEKSDIHYYQFKLANASTDYTEVINKLNQKIKKLYEDNKNTNLDSLECINYKDKYKYRYIHYIDYYWGENNKYITLSYQNETTDICLDTSVKEEPEVFILSKDNNKLLTQEEFIKQEKITKDDIETTINGGILLNNYYLEKENDKTRVKQDYQYTKKDNKLYYKFFILEDNIYTYYYQSNNNTFYQTKAIINKK